MARFFGNSSPSSICTIVENSSARTAPMPTLTPVAMWRPPSSEPSDSPISGSVT
jgi:hypothetical protein